MEVSHHAELDYNMKWETLM